MNPGDIGVAVLRNQYDEAIKDKEFYQLALEHEVSVVQVLIAAGWVTQDTIDQARKIVWAVIKD